MFTTAIMNPAAEGGVVELRNPPREIVDALDPRRAAGSILVATEGRLPTGDAAAMTRDALLSLPGTHAVFTRREVVNEAGQTTVRAGAVGVSWFLGSADDDVQGSILPSLYYLQSNLTIGDCVDLVAGSNFLFQVRRGTVGAGPSAPATVNIEGDKWHTSLAFTEWTANQFNTSWRMRLGTTSDGRWPVLDVATADTLWGFDSTADVVVSPVLDPSPTARDLAGWRILRANTATTSDGEKITSRVYVPEDDGALWAAGVYGSAQTAIAPLHWNTLGTLQRERVVPSRVKGGTVGQYNSAARRILSEVRPPVVEWTVDLANPDDAAVLQLGQPVAVFDPVVGAVDAANLVDAGVQGAAPRRGFRVSERRPPWSSERNGLYMVSSANWSTILDLTDWAVDVDGIATIREGTQRPPSYSGAGSRQA